MKSVFQTLLNLLLVVSLSAAPVTAALASAGSATAVSAGSELSHTSGLEQDSAGMHEKLPAPVPCMADTDECICPGSTGCQHVSVSTSLALPAELLEFSTLARELPVTGLQENPASLSLPPESPPPIA